jgi:Big-like domain-containing protein
MMSTVRFRRQHNFARRVGAVAAVGALAAGFVGASPAAASGPSASTLTVSPNSFTLPATASGSRSVNFTWTFTSGNDASGGAKLKIPFPTGFSAPVLANQVATPGAGCTSATVKKVQNQTVTVKFACSAHGIFTVTSSNEVVPSTAGAYQVVATTTAAPLVGAPTITVLPGPLAKLALSGVPAATDSDVAFGSVVVTAEDAFGNTVPSFAGTVKFGTTDTGATTPAPYTYVPGTDHGVHDFAGVLFYAPGSEILTAGCPTCSSPPSQGSANTMVSAPSAISVTPAADSIPVGDTLQYAATGTYPDGTHSISSFVQWAGNSASTATVSSSGLASAVNPGAVSVSATLEGVTGTTGLTVTAAGTTVAATPGGSTTYGTAGSVDVTVTANAPGAGTPAGTVTVTNAANTTVGSGTLSGGSAVITLADNLPAGSDALTVTYNGNTDYSASSTTVTQTVGTFTPTVTVTPDQSSVTAGTTVNVTVNISSACSDCAAPSGSVSDLEATGQNTDTVIDLGSQSLTSGSTTYAWDTTSATPDTYNLVATYPGDSNYSSSNNSGSPATVTVNSP